MTKFQRQRSAKRYHRPAFGRSAHFTKRPKAKAKAPTSRSNPLQFVFETLKATNVYFLSDGRVHVDGLESPEDFDLSDDIKDEP